MRKTIRRRRKEAKTDYKARLSLLKAHQPRLVVRKTNRYIIVQVVESDIAQDKVVVESKSKELLKKGWPEAKAGSLKSLAAAYLTGLMIAHKMKGKKEKLVLDIGMHRNVKGSRVLAALKGAVDGGLNIPHNLESLPSEERISGNKKTSELLTKLKGKI